MTPPAVKLVVWDLDDTFWSGTLSEGGVEPVGAHCDAIFELARRGIVSSICSKNSRDAAEAELRAHGMWDHFVFPHIAWEPKGPALASLIDRMQLRPENALFLDDEPSNLEEARHYCPGLQVAGPEAIPGLLLRPELAGRPDPECERLAHYRVLEQRSIDREQSGVDNLEFLRRSDIEVEWRRDARDDLARVAELVARTNQLNFTKRRLSQDALALQLAEPGVESGTLRVRDRYGDYGLCGFYALRGGTLLHFLFSCRVLHMGVEQWLYAQLGEPALAIDGEVASDPGDPARVDWIREAPGAADPDGSAPPREPAGQGPALPVFAKGGCDLEQVVDFLGERRLVETEWNYVGASGQMVHAEHSEILKLAGGEHVDAWGDALAQLPFLDRRAYQTRMFSGEHAVVVYSVLMDYSQALYRYRGHAWRVPWGNFASDLTSPAGQALARDGKGLSQEFLDWFAEHFEFEGPIGESDFAANLRALRARLAPGQLLVLINAAEVPDACSDEPDRHAHHARMNAVLEATVAELPHTEVCDVRPFARAREDLVDSLRHYRRHVHHAVAEDLRTRIARHAERELPAAGPVQRALSVASRKGRQLWQEFAARRR